MSVDGTDQRLARNAGLVSSRTSRLNGSTACALSRLGCDCSPSSCVGLRFAIRPGRPATSSSPNENLVTDGIPPIPRALADDVGRYTEFRVALLLDWHPTRAARCSSPRGSPTRPGPPREVPRRRAHAAHVLPRARRRGVLPQRNAGDYFVFSKDVGGNEFAQNFRFDLATGAVTLLTDGKSQEQRRRVVATPATRSPTPPPAATARTPTCTSSTPPTRRPTSSSRRSRAAAGAPSTGRRTTSRILLGEYVSVNESYLWLVDATTGEKKLLTPRKAEGGEPVSYGGGEFAADGKAFYTTTDKGSEFQRLARVDLATRRAHVPHRGHQLGRRGLRRLPRRQAHRVRRQRGRRQRRCTCSTPPPARTLPKPQIPLGVIYNIRWHENSRDLGVHAVVGAVDAPTSTRSTSTTGKVERWTESETGGLNPQTFAEPQLVRWTSFDGREISGFLYPPDPAESSPASGRSSSTSTAGPRASPARGFLGRRNYFINELGVALIFPNVRGSSRLRQELPEARQRREARGLRQGHRRPARLDQDPARPRRRPRDGHRRQLRRVHDARRRASTTPTASAARSTSSASPTSSRSSRAPRPTAATCAASSTATSATRRCASASSGSPR